MWAAPQTAIPALNKRLHSNGDDASPFETRLDAAAIHIMRTEKAAGKGAKKLRTGV